MEVNLGLCIVPTWLCPRYCGFAQRLIPLLICRYELGRQPANTKLSSNKTVRRVRVRGGNVKWRALRLDTGNSWMLSTMRQTMSLFGPRPLWRAPLCKLMLPHSSSGTSLTMEWTLVGRRRPRLLRRMLLRYHSFQPKFSVGCEIMYCLFFYFVRDLATAHACVY